MGDEERGQKQARMLSQKCVRRIAKVKLFDDRNNRTSTAKAKKLVDNIERIKTVLETRRARWFEKIGNMDETRTSRKLIGAWCKTP